MVCILILLIAALAVVVAIHLAKAKLPQYRRMDREEIEQSPNSDFSFDWGNKRKGGDYDVVQKLGCISRVWRLTENEEGSLNLIKKKGLVVTLSLLLVL